MKTFFRLSILGILLSIFACQSNSTDSTEESTAENTDQIEGTETNSTEASAENEPQFTMITGPDAKKEEKVKKGPEPLAVEIPLKPKEKAGVSSFQEYTCMGNEPNWNIQIKPSGITWFLMGQQRVKFPYKKPAEEGNAIVFQSKNERSNITIKIIKEQCADTMADVMHPFTSEINVDGTVFKGCAQ